MARDGSVRLTEGSIFKKLILFALPILVGQLLQTLYNSVDSIVIGNFVGTEALAAVTASASIANTLAGFFNGMSAGASVLFSHHFGAGELGKLRRAIHTTMLFSILLSILMAGVGILITPLLLRIVSCPDGVYTQALLYLRIYLVGILFTSIYNISAGVLRSVGDSRSPFLFLFTASMMNIVLDILFVAVFCMGVAGVAIATVLSQGVSVILSVRKMTRMNDAYRFRFREMSIDWKVLKKVSSLGLPAGIQSSLISISAIFIQRYINSFGPAAMAGIGAGMRIDQFAGMPCTALGLAMTTFTGQNVGAGKYDRTHKAVRIAFLAVVIQIVSLGVPMYIFAPKLARIFGSDPAVIEVCTIFLRTILPVYLCMGTNGLMGGIVRGYGYSLVSMIMALNGMIVVRQLWLAIALPIRHEVTTIVYCFPLGWFASAVPLILFYLIHIRRKYPERLREPA